MSVTPARVVSRQTTADFGYESSLTITITGNAFAFTAVVDTTTTNQDLSISTGTASIFIDGATTANQTITFTQGRSSPPRITKTETFTTPITNATSTIRLTISLQGTAFELPPVTFGTINYDQTFTVRKPTSVTGNILTANTVTRPWIMFLPSNIDPTLLHIKNIGNQIMHLRVDTRNIDDSNTSIEIPANAGLTMFEDANSNWFISSYFGGTVTGGSSTGGTTATSPVVLANITSGNKSVGLPNPATASFSQLCICGYSTGTPNLTNSLVIITNGHARETTSSSYSFAPAFGIAVGLYLVSDGTKWNIVGIFRGNQITYDNLLSERTPLFSPIAISSSIFTDTVELGKDIDVADTARFHIWKTKEITYTNGACVSTPGANVVNTNYQRLFRNTGADYTSLMVVNAKIGTGTLTAFPIAQYPSDN